MSRTPDQRLALEKYRRKVATYDETNRFGRFRRRAVSRLGLRPGDAVLDVACGTGLNFPLLQSGIGPSGRRPSKTRIWPCRGRARVWPVSRVSG